MTDRELMQEVLEALQAVREAPASKDEIQRAWIVSDLLRRRLAQPDREWVGLTDDDLRQIILVAVGVAEAKLKEKNT
jgi:hypothetical protein